MDGYILDLREKYGHMPPNKQQYLPCKHRPIDYGTNQQMVRPTDTSPSHDDKGIQRVHDIVGALLSVGKTVNNKLLVVLSAIGSQQAVNTK